MSTQLATNAPIHAGSERVFLFLTAPQWRKGVLLAFVIGVMGYGFTANVSAWIGVSLALAALSVFHLSYASRFILGLPHIAVLIAILQYVFAAWINFYYPPENPTYDIGSNLSFYLEYAGPVVVAVTLGWAFAMSGLSAKRPEMGKPNPALQAELDILFFLGIVGFLARRFVHLESIDFVLLLIANLRFVGAFGRMLLRGSGWTWRICLLLGVEAGLAAGSTMFHDLLLWTLWTFVVWIYSFRPRRRIIAGAIASAALFLPALQEAKWALRQGLSEDDPAFDYDRTVAEQSLNQAVLWLRYLGPAFGHTLTMRLEPGFIADTAVRYNQGWIINRIMVFVPDIEPYAMGATLKEDALGAVVPRIVNPDKLSSGGRVNMLRFAGIELGDSTSMTLGYAGEMYANFGPIGGAIGCFGYALFFGLIFRFICRRAFNAPLWWCVVPYVFYTAVKAEDDISHVLNWTVKGSLLLAVVFLAFPHLRRALRGGGANVVSASQLPQFSNSNSTPHVSARPS